MKKQVLFIFMFGAMQTGLTQNVGVGTALPLQKLHVEGNQYISQNLGIGLTAPNAPLQFANTNANRKSTVIDPILHCVNSF